MKQNFFLKASKVLPRGADSPYVDGICALFRILGDSLDLDETLARFDGELQRHIAYEALALYVVEEGRLQAAYASGVESAALVALECAVGEGFLGRSVESRHPQQIARPEGLGSRSTVSVFPLEHEDAIGAVLALVRSTSADFSTEDWDLLSAVAPKLASAVENARAFQDLAKMAGIDPVTGACNARSLFLRLDAEIARCRRRRDRIAVLECAIEGLDRSVPELERTVNRRIAGALRNGCREYDVLARTGDNFVLVLAGFEPRDLAEKCVSLQSRVEDIGMAAGLPLAAVVGAAFFPEDADDADGLLAVASERLLDAKHHSCGGSR